MAAQHASTPQEAQSNSLSQQPSADNTLMLKSFMQADTQAVPSGYPRYSRSLSKTQPSPGICNQHLSKLAVGTPRSMLGVQPLPAPEHACIHPSSAQFTPSSPPCSQCLPPLTDWHRLMWAAPRAYKHFPSLRTCGSPNLTHFSSCVSCWQAICLLLPG